MPISIRRSIPAACAAFALSVASTAARADDFDWLGIAYVWAADITVDSRDTSVGIDFSDVVDKLEVGFQGHVEVQGETLGGFVDVSFMALGDNSSRAAADLNADVDMTALDMALVWSPGDETYTGLELYGGLRYIDTDFSLVVDPVPPALPTVATGVNTSYTDLLLGARYGAPLSDRWKLIVNADFSELDTEGTWSLGIFGAYRSGAHHFYAGYRHFEMDLEGGQGERVTETFSGPAIAYGFSF